MSSYEYENKLRFAKATQVVCGSESAECLHC